MADKRDLRVLQILDTLDAGGAERLAVHLANQLAANGFGSYVCTTRRPGSLVRELDPRVEHVDLGRTRRIAPGALLRLWAFVRNHRIDIVHAHSTSLFAGALVRLLPPFPRLLWHVHEGGYAEESAGVVRTLAARRCDHVITVTRPLVDWCRSRLGIARRRVAFVPNFVPIPPADHEPVLTSPLPGTPGARIVNVANLRQNKDQLNLIAAFQVVVRSRPDAHLLLVGNANDPAYRDRIVRAVERAGLGDHVSLLGRRTDVPAILRASNVGVLSSRIEGLPMTLLEYGVAGLPTVATDVGQCAEVLGNGHDGLVVRPRDRDALAEALLRLLGDEGDAFGKRLRGAVEKRYSADVVRSQLVHCYRRLAA